MNLIGGVQKLLGKAGNTVRNDVVGPVQRDLLHPAQNAIHQLLNNQPPLPFGMDETTQNLYNQTNQDYSFSPGFSQTLQQQQPLVANRPVSSAALKSGAAGGVYFPMGYPGAQSQSHRIQIDHSKYPYTKTEEDALLHEGLHATYDRQTPEQQQQFINTFNSSATPDLKQYLNNRLSGYAAYGGIQQLDNLATAPQSIQNEVHSYIPEHYSRYATGTHYEQPQPKQLVDYYSKYYSPQNLVDRNSAKLGIQQMISPVNPYGTDY